MVPASSTVVAVKFVVVAFVDVRFVSTAVVALRFVDVRFTVVSSPITPLTAATFTAVRSGVYERALTTLTPSLYTQAVEPAGTVIPVPAAVLTTIASAQSFWTMYGFSIEGTTRLRVEPPVVPVQRSRKLRAV
jgi:hypothetical protein